jgi:hypothetical protein
MVALAAAGESVKVLANLPRVKSTAWQINFISLYQQN